MPLICVADSTVMNGFSLSRMTNSEPVGFVRSFVAVPRPVGPCAPTSETFLFNVNPPSIGYPSSVGSTKSAPPLYAMLSIAF